MLCVLISLGGILCAQNAPNWLWSRRAGSTEEDLGSSISLDGNGNVYFTGLFAGTVAFGSTTLTSAGGTDIFIAKLDTDGNWLWARRAGGPNYEHAYGIRSTSEGISYITGYFQGNADFGPTVLGSAGEGDIYIAKLDAGGLWFWAIRAGGSLHDQGNGISVDPAGNCFVTGYFQGQAQFGTYQLTSAGNRDLFIAKVDTDGNWAWIRRAGGIGDDRGYGIGADNLGNCYVTGYFPATTLFGNIQLNNGGVFVVKLDALGNWLWAKKADGNNYAGGAGIATSGEGLCHITGHFEASVSFGIHTIASLGDRDVFMACLDSNGTWLWARSGGSSGYDVGLGVCADAAGNSYYTGRFSGAGSFGPNALTSAGDADIYIACLNPEGNWLWAVRAGGSYLDFGNALAVDSGGSTFFTGEFWTTADFGAINLTSSGYNDIAICKLGTGVPVDDAIQIPPTAIQMRNYPNPFNPETTIEFGVPASGQTRLQVYNLKGQLVRTLVDEFREAGKHSDVWNGRDDSGNEVSSGVYLYRLDNGSRFSTRKMLLLK